MKRVEVNGKTYSILYRPQWEQIFKTYGGFEKWRTAKINRLETKGQHKLAEWYREANVLDIGRREGQISVKIEILKKEHKNG